MSRQDPILHAPLLALTLRQGLPLALGMASHVLFNLVDLLLVGHLGAAAVAGVHVATTINFLAMIIGNGVTVAALSLLSRALGAGQPARAREVNSRLQVLMIALGVVLGGIGALLVVPCIDLQGVIGEARGIGIHYLLVSNLGTVTMFVLMATTTTMRALGEGWMPFFLLIGANVLNLVLDVVLLFGWDALGIPAFGAPGAAYGTVIARGVFGAVGLWWIRRPGYRLRPVLPRRMATRAAQARWQILLLGMPQSMQMFVRAVVVIALTRLAGDLAGQDAIAALGVTTRLDTMILFAAVGFASAATAIAGRNAGAGRWDRVHGACLAAGVWALVVGGIMVAGFALNARWLIDLFIRDAAEPVVVAGALYLRVAALGQPLAAFAIALGGGINGSGRMLAPMVIDAIAYLGLLLPAAIVFGSTVEGASLRGVWWIFVAAHIALAGAYLWYLRARFASSARRTQPLPE